jgi:hypothetical protein
MIVSRRVKLGLCFEGLQAVEEGVEAGQRLVVVGLQRVRPGIQVEAEEVDMQSFAGPAPFKSQASGKPDSKEMRPAKISVVESAEAVVPPKN